MNSQEKFLYQITRFVWYCFSVIEALLLVRFVFKLFGANPAANFTNFIYTFSGFFVSPFQFVFGSPSVGIGAIDMSTLLAIVMYWLLAWAIVSLVVLNRKVDQHEASEELRAQENHG